MARNHIIISGTGRAGTTFLIQVLSELGMDTGFNNSYHNINKNCNAGLEKDIFNDKAPYIIKSPWLSDHIDKVLESDRIVIDHAIIPIRDLFEAAESRRDVTRRSPVDKSEITPGGIWNTDHPEMQESVLAVKLYNLIYHLVRHNTPITMLDFPRFALDKEYFYAKMLTVFPELDNKLFSAAFDKISDPAKIHKFEPDEKSGIPVKLTNEPETLSQDLDTVASNAMFWQPRHLVNPDSWVGHIPFAFWLVEKMRPRLFVELGTHTGNSYLAFCQAIKLLNLETRSFAVDTWKGDEHSGAYSEEVFAMMVKCNAGYSAFSSLIRSTFDEALNTFQDHSIDLLHIDGFHSYAAVKHDFETWLPKMAAKSIILFHDTNVRERGFGVHKFFSELKSRYPHFEMMHSNGLGVLKIGSGHHPELEKLFNPENQLLIDAFRERLTVLGNGLICKLSVKAGNPARIAQPGSALSWPRRIGRKSARFFRRIFE